MNIGIVAACLPTLKPLFVTFFEKARALTISGGRGGRSYAAYYRHADEPASISMSELVDSKSAADAWRLGPIDGDRDDGDRAPLRAGPETPRPAAARQRGIVQTREIYVA